MTNNNKKLPFHRVYTGMPVYNGEQYLEDSIKCNLNQTYDDFAILISDNASTDRTEQICRDYASSDARVIYTRNDVNVGAAPNYTKCFEPTNCEFFRWSNADDLIEPTLIADCLAVLEEHKDAILAYGKTRLIDGDGVFMEDYDDRMHLVDDSPVERFLVCRQTLGLSNIIYGLMRRDLLAQTALFESFVASDSNLIAELTLYGKFYEIPKTLFSRRMHEDSTSHNREDTELQKAFWDPGKRHFLMQLWKRMVAYFGAVSRSPLGASEKRKLYWYLSKTVYWKKGKLSREIANYMRYGFLRRS